MTNCSKRPFFLSLSLVILLCFCHLACGTQPNPEENAKQKVAPVPGAPAGGIGTPKTSADYVSQGKEALKAQQFDQAIISFSEAVKLDSQSILALNNRGIAHCSKGNFDQAIGDFSRIIEIDPKFAKAYNNRAVAYMMKGDKDKAWQDVEKAQSLGLQMNQMLIESLKPGVAKAAEPGKSEAAQGKEPAPGQPAAKDKDKGETKGKGEAKKK
jgi:tetratricopeptide (TPR) repeat protein